MVQGLPHDIYSLLPYSRPLWQTASAGVAAFLILCALAWWFYQWSKKRRLKVAQETIKTPWELLEDELESLSPSLATGDEKKVRDLFYGLSLVLRRGIELSSGIRATDLTVQEIKARLRNHLTFDAELGKNFVQFLERADLIKFAEVPPYPNEARESFLAIKQWLSVLKPQPVNPFTSETPRDSRLEGRL